MNRKKFRKLAPSLTSVIAGVALKDMNPREHKTGSLGWRHNDKLDIRIGDETCRVQVNIAVTLIGSKAMPEDDAPPVPALAGVTG